MKKILALVIAALMIVASMSALAETVTNTAINNGSFSITITKDATDKAAHTYGAYQIFKGDLAETTDASGNVTKKVLSNIQWGSNIDSTKIADMITAINTELGTTLATNASAEKVAEEIGKKALAADSAKAQALAEIFAAALTGSAVKTADVAANGSSATITGLNAGYYFVKDENDVNGEGAETRFILEVVSNVSTAEKASVPTVSKWTDDKIDTTTAEDAINWAKTADYDLNDVVPFKIVGTLPSTYDDYDWYAYKFTDTMSHGLTLNSDSVKVVLFASKAAAVAATAATEGTDITSMFTKSVESKTNTTDNTTDTVLTLNCPVVVANPNANPAVAANNGLKENSAITKDSAIVVFYTATVNGTAVIGNPGNPNEVDLEFSNNPNKGGEGDTGTTPKDKNIIFTLRTVVNKVDGENKPLAGATFKLYKKYVNAAAVTAAGKTAATKPTVTPTAMTDDAWNALVTGDQVLVDVGEAVLTNEGTTFTFNHIDDGDYVLVETVTPAGYNSIAPYPFSVSATHDLTGITDLTSNEMDTEKTTGTLSKDIQNNSGSQLPSTGGIGTTIFYVGGGLLVLAAVILLVTKRRMSSND